MLYTLHQVHSISDEALRNDFDRQCRRIIVRLRWFFGACFMAILLTPAWLLLPWAAPVFPFKVLDWLMLLLVLSGASYILADAWSMARGMERSHLRLGILLGGSDKFATLAVISGARAIWHNLPSGSGAIEQSLYWSLGAFIGASGLGGILANMSIARTAYQRNILSLAICQHTQVASASS